MQQDYKSLLETVKYHAVLYYDKAAPVLSDQEYDTLYDKLKLMEERQGWADSSSPTLNVGASPGKVKHPFKLYSLRKVYEADEIDKEFTIVSVKIDGANLSITYNKDGSIRHALTRGDGEFGEDVTHLIKYIKGIPSKISNSNTTTVVGEVVTDKKDVLNFRNFVSGSLGVKNPEDIKDRELLFIAHDVLGLDQNYTQRMQYASSQGFFDSLTFEGINNYPTDGWVYRVDSYKEEKYLGYTSKYPRFAVALKTKGAYTAVTTIQDVVWSLGRTGAVTPVAVVDPVVIDDATISRVILHNIEFIEQNNLGPGDQIVIERQITPQFVKVLSHSSFARFSASDAEKQLGTQLERKGPKLFASTQDSHKNVEYFVKQLGIKGLGPKWIEKLNLTHPSDLFSETVPWEEMGKNGEKILEELSRPKPYEAVLASLGIPGVGKSTAKTIIEKLPSFDRLKDIQYESIKGIGPKTVENILAWLDVNESWVKDLPYSLSESPKGKDTGSEIVVVISGKLDMTKEDLTEHLAKYNVIVKDTITKNVDYLISSGEQSTKVAKAQKYGIPILNYWDNKIAILKGEFYGRDH